jgi:hypothetical protein
MNKIRDEFERMAVEPSWVMKNKIEARRKYINEVLDEISEEIGINKEQPLTLHTAKAVGFLSG